MPNKYERGERLQLMLTGDELNALDDFRFKYRMPSRAAAIRELLKRGLANHEDSATIRVKSRDFGVLENEHIKSQSSDTDEK